jgi:hypothetical protein
MGGAMAVAGGALVMLAGNAAAVRFAVGVRAGTRVSFD